MDVAELNIAGFPYGPEIFFRRYRKACQSEIFPQSIEHETMPTTIEMVLNEFPGFREFGLADIANVVLEQKPNYYSNGLLGHSCHGRLLSRLASPRATGSVK